MAIAIEDLTPAAQAVAARLHPKVKEYLEAKAGREAAAAADRAAAKKSARSGAQDGQRSSSRSQDTSGSSGGGGLASAARFEKQLDALTPGRGPSTSGGRLVTALFLGIIALEVLSTMLGQPFSYSLKGTAAALAKTGKTPYTPLYGGQKSPAQQPVSAMAGHGL